MKHILKILLILLALTAFTVSFVPVSVMASNEYLSIIVSSNIEAQIEPAPIDTSPPSLDIRFEPSGTSVHKGDLKIRLDFYPQPEDKSYSMHHVFVVDETSPEFLDGYKGEVDKDGNPIDFTDYEKWIEGLPHIWRTNPALCHFLTVKPDITLAELDQIVSTMFSGNVTATIDDIMSKTGEHESAHLISPYMKFKSVTTSEKACTTASTMALMRASGVLTDEEILEADTDEAKLIVLAQKIMVWEKVNIINPLVETINSRLAGFTRGGEGGGRVESVRPRSIDVGPGATDRATYFSAASTYVDLNNPANADGNLDTMEIWPYGNLQALVIGTFSGSGTSYNDRDYESIGDATSGSKQTYTGKSCDVITGDFLGCYYVTGTVERDTTGSSGVYYKSGNQFGTGAQTYVLIAGDAISIYATGTEPATYDISNTPSSKAFGAVASGTTYWSSGAAPSGNLDDAEALFTVTAAGSAAVDVDFHGHNATEGIDCALTSSAPGANEYRVKVYKEGDAVPAGGAYLTTADAEIISNLASSATIDWEISLEIGTPGDGVQKSGIITLTGRAVT